MKLVAQYVDSGDATEASSRLRDSGVMTEVTIVDPHNMKPSKSGAQRVALWVVFEDQFDDAVQLLKNPGHVPKRRITLNEMMATKSSTHGNQFKSVKRLFERIKNFFTGFI